MASEFREVRFRLLRRTREAGKFVDGKQTESESVCADFDADHCDAEFEGPVGQWPAATSGFRTINRLNPAMNTVSMTTVHEPRRWAMSMVARTTPLRGRQVWSVMETGPFDFAEYRGREEPAVHGVDAVFLDLFGDRRAALADPHPAGRPRGQSAVC